MSAHISSNYDQVKLHYQSLLSVHYTWMFNGPQYKQELFQRLSLDVKGKEDENSAVDLGCGTGFQAIPLASLGWKVLGIDSSPFLLSEMKEEALKRNLNISAVEGIFLSTQGICS